jgi:hypothetical protein
MERPKKLAMSSFFIFISFVELGVARALQNGKKSLEYSPI